MSMGINNKHFKQTEIGKIPKDWKVVRLESLISEIKNGFASGKRDENGIVQIRMNNVTTDGQLILDSYLKVPIPDNVNDWILKEGDFLFNNTNSYDLVGKSAIFKGTPFPCTFSNHFTRIRFKQDLVIPEIILYHFILLWKKGYFKSIAIRHVGQSAVHTQYLLKLTLPLPPLPEQQKIAEILSTVDAAIEKVDESIAKTERLKKGLMQTLLTKGIKYSGFKIQDDRYFKDTEIGRIPKEWEVVRIKNIGKVFTGKTPSTSKDIYWNGDIPFITPEDMTGGKYVYRTNRYVSFEGANQSGKILPPNTVLVVCIGSTVGKVALTHKESVTNQQINSVLCKEKVDHDYVYYAISHRSYMLKNYSGVAAVPIVKKSLFEEFKIPLPQKISEQKKIAEILCTVDNRLELLRNKKEKLTKVKKGLMNSLLTGKKRVKI